MQTRLLLALALVPALAGCAEPPQEGEELDRGLIGRLPFPEWKDPASALIRPGIPIQTEKRDCPSNFVFARTDNGSIFLGTTAHCVRDLPVGSLATLGDDMHLAILIYSSWAAMDELGETDPGAREYNDFAVFHIDSSARPDVSPALMDIGGPVAPAQAEKVAMGDRLLAYHSPVAEASGWRSAVVTGQIEKWALLVHGLPPSLPGGMGGAVLTPSGEALGITVSLTVNPNPGSNAVARLDALMEYARLHANLEMVLATWAFDGAPVV